MSLESKRAPVLFIECIIAEFFLEELLRMRLAGFVQLNRNGSESEIDSCITATDATHILLLYGEINALLDGDRAFVEPCRRI